MDMVVSYGVLGCNNGSRGPIIIATVIHNLHYGIHRRSPIQQQEDTYRILGEMGRMARKNMGTNSKHFGQKCYSVIQNQISGAVIFICLTCRRVKKFE